MAPQQNSTLIDDNLEKIPSLINICERESYSPILPPQNNLHNGKNNYNNKSKCQKNTQKADIYDNKKWQKNKTSQRTESNHCSRSQRCRSVSLYGVNSTMELGHKEIPIWLDDEPRYVSGVTNKTTCNDVVKALIDDEFRSGNFAYCKRGPDGAASRDYSDYVITESWRGIERSYDSNMAILPVWKAWSRVHNELRLSLKHRSQINSPLRKIQPQRRFTAFRKYFIKLLRFAKKTKTKDVKTVEQKEVKGLLSSQNKIPDEFFFVLLPDNLRNAEHRIEGKTNNFTPAIEESSNQTKPKLVNDKLYENYKLYRLSETASTKKRRAAFSRYSKDKGVTADRGRRPQTFDSNVIKRRQDVPNRNSIRNQLAQKTGNVNHLYDREYALTKQLTNACKLYKLHNYLYMEPEKHLELSVGEIQRNIEKHVEEIIKTEHELLEVKKEIKQDLSIINNLKRLTLSSKNKCIASLEAIPAKESCAADPAAKGGDDHMQFVDNIYEFCDNNASMLV